MGLVVQHNLPAINAQNQMRINLSNNQKASEKLSSGYRINRAGDDAAGLAISEKMRGQIRGLDQAAANAQDGISLVQTAEGALQETHSILQRMRELAVQSANGTYQNEVDRENINKEVEALKSEIDRIAESTHFNGKKLLNGDMKGEEVKGSAAKIATEDDAAAAAKAVLAGTLAAGTAGVAFAGSDPANAEEAKAQNDLAKAIASTTFAVTAENKFTAKEFGDYSIDEDGKITKTGSADELATMTASNNPGDASFTITSNANAEIKEGDKIAAVNDQGKLILQIGANGSADQEVSLEVDDQSSTGLNLTDVSVGTRQDAKAAIASIDDAINSVSGTRADLGALQNRLEHTINSLSTTSENLTAAESRIRDTDMAKEMMNYTKSNILQQAAQAMLAQANVQPQSVLQLLG